MIKKNLPKDKRKVVAKRSLLNIFFFLLGSLLIITGSFGVYVWSWEDRAHVLEVHSLLIDGNIVIFIRTPENHTVLIDSGKTEAVIRALTKLMPFYRRTIDAVILTKPDDSHVTGLVSVLGRYKVGQVIEAAMSMSFATATTSTFSASIPASSTAYLAFEKIIDDKKIDHKMVQRGDKISFENGQYGSVVADTIFPSFAGDFKFSKTNMPMLAMRIQYGSTSFLVADLSKNEQKYVANSSDSSSTSTATVLISQHAGSVGAVDEHFLSALHPDYVVISKKPQNVQKSPRAVKTSKTSTKIAKIPFSIFDAGLNIINLIDAGDTEFISDGKTISVKKE